MAQSSPEVEQQLQHDAAAVDHDGGEATPLVRLLDFAQPTKFTIEIRRRITAALGPPCETLAASLASELKVDVEVEIGEVVQHTWAAARAALASDAVPVAIGAQGSASGLLLSVELAWVLQALECVLGGQAENAPATRRLTDLDRTLVQGLLDTIVSELSAAWAELGGAPLQRGEIALEGDAGMLVAPGEPTLSVTLGCHLDGAGADMVLLIPWMTVAPLVKSGQGSRAPTESPYAARDAERLRRGLAEAPVLLRAEVGSVQMAIERVLDLAPGATVTLDERAADGARVFAGDVCLGRGRPGRSGSRRAVKVEAGELQERAQTYATLGRTELELARAWVGGEMDGERPEILHSIFVRLWVELGRTYQPLGDATEVAPGAVIELDQAADAPVEVFANGLCLARGALVVMPEGSWGVRVESIV